MRASDADRERVVAVLQHARADGRITVDEFGERSAVGYAARTQDELAGLTRDLLPAPPGAPTPHPPGPAPRAGGGGRGGGPRGVGAGSGARGRAGRWRPARRETAVAVFGG